MDAVFMTSWTVPFPGREHKALEFGVEAVEFWSKQAADGRCTEPEWFFFPEGVGHFLVKGDRVALEEILDSDEGRHMLRRGVLLMQDWKYALGDTGSAAERFMADYGAELASI